MGKRLGGAEGSAFRGLDPQSTGSLQPPAILVGTAELMMAKMVTYEFMKHSTRIGVRHIMVQTR